MQRLRLFKRRENQRTHRWIWVFGLRKQDYDKITGGIEDMTTPFTIRISEARRMLLQAVFWCLFVFWPLLFRSHTVHVPRFHQPPDPVYMAALNGLAVLFFYLNTRILIPRFLEKKGLSMYLLVVAACGLVMVLLSLELRSLAFRADLTDVRFITGTIFPVLFIFSLSTTYKVLNDFHRRQQLEKERENERLKSELSFLRSQISPHFLFNILNSIVSLARFKPESVEPATIQLAELMRYMLYESDEAKVPMDQEIRYLRSYIDLQTLRLGKKVQIDLDLGAVAGNYSIEPMLLIPFVENAFKHGIGMISRPAIQLQLHVRERMLYFLVKNKVSMQPDDPKDHHSGIGLKNVERRLNLLYPNHDLQIRENEGWYAVQLTLELS
ncbi:histidine kinase [Siphonobacter sp. BAB-5405]|nr:histidine kinase [Siphonobacter sp. BAB-5405]